MSTSSIHLRVKVVDYWNVKSRHGPWVPKYIRFPRVDGHSWSHCCRSRYYGRRKPRNRFMLRMRWRHEGRGMERWKPRGMPFMDRRSTGGVARNLRYWRW